jgi:hypothetical protein
VDSDTATILEDAKTLHAEIVTEISGLHAAAGLDQEKELLDKIERLEWGKTIGDYMQANWSTGFYSRDSTAISQGTRVPAHLYFKADAYQSDTRCAAVRTFFSESRRFLRQVALNASGLQQVEDASQKALNAVLAVCDRFHQASVRAEESRIFRFDFVALQIPSDCGVPPPQPDGKTAHCTDRALPLHALRPRVLQISRDRKLPLRFGNRSTGGLGSFLWTRQKELVRADGDELAKGPTGVFSAEVTRYRIEAEFECHNGPHGPTGVYCGLSRILAAGL